MKKINYKDRYVFHKEISAQIEHPNDDIIVIGDYNTVIDLFNYLMHKYPGLHLCEADIRYYVYPEGDEAFSLSIYDKDVYITRAYNDVHKKYYHFLGSYVYVKKEFLSNYLESNGVEGLIVFDFDSSLTKDKDTMSINFSKDYKSYSITYNTGNGDFPLIIMVLKS